MSQNICEYLRERIITELFTSLNTFDYCWPVWKAEINSYIGEITPTNIINLGDRLSDIFRSTGEKGRSQSEVSGGGTVWEALVCWYMNLCLLESRTVVIKHKKQLIPEPVRQAITVKYGTFPSNTESDLIAITFPDKPDYLIMDKYDITARDKNGNMIKPLVGRDKYNYTPIIDYLSDRDFNDYEIGIIQCKTNWNDNAQIPMLWDMIYASNGSFSRNITIGSSAYSIRNIRKFTYSFVTVPTTSGKITSESTCVKRVQNISGGNYWGRATQPSVAHSIKDIFGNNFTSGTPNGIRSSLSNALPKLYTHYSYFRL